MSNMFDIDALPDKEVAEPADQPPKKWLKHNAAEWYFKLQELKQARQKIIKENPTDLTECSCIITLAQFSEAMGKHKSHLAPSKWKKESTGLEKAKAFTVKELEKVNCRLLEAWKLGSEKYKPPGSTTKSKATLARQLMETEDRLRLAKPEAWAVSFGQINDDSVSLVNKVNELQEALKAAKESSDNLRRNQQEAMKNRTRDLAEIKRLEELNAVLGNELEEAKASIEKLEAKATETKGELITLPEREVDISSPPASINHMAWVEWIGYRAGKRKPVSPAAAKKQWETLSQHSHAAQAKYINESIANDYQGLFPPKSGDGGTRDRSLEQDLTDTSWAE